MSAGTGMNGQRRNLRPSARRAIKWYANATPEERATFHARVGASDDATAREHVEAIVAAALDSSTPNQPTESTT